MYARGAKAAKGVVAYRPQRRVGVRVTQLSE